jgi:hypothetical protein
MSEDLSLDDMGILEGTNKSSLLVDYLRHFERLFSDCRNDPMNIIEIGVDEGASMRTWRRFFPKATIIGVDIYEDRKQYASDRVIIEIGSQSDLGLLTRLCEKYKPKIVIDDGSHLARDVLFTFQTMFPSLLPGGFYVMEDLYHHYGKLGKTYSRDTPVLPSEYMFSLGHNLLSNSMEQTQYYGLQKYLFDHIDRIEIIRNAVVICKKKEQDQAQVHANWLHLVEQTNHVRNWAMLAEQLAKGGGSLELAATAIRRCIEFEPNNLYYHYLLADFLDRMGDLDGAILEASRALELSTSEENRLAAQNRVDSLTAKAEKRA